MKHKSVAITAWLHLFCASAAFGQTFFGSVGVESATGVERGSTALVESVEKTTSFLTFDTFGSDDAGPLVSSLTFALPGILRPDGQLDMTAVVAGPGETRATELRAAGLGYRLKRGEGLTFYVNGTYAEATPDGPATTAFAIDGFRRQIALGARRQIRSQTGSVITQVLELRARETRATSLGVPVVDERIQSVFAGIRRTTGRPFELQTRLGAAISAGFADYGDPNTRGSLASHPGASESFFRVSASAEASLPLSSLWAINAGIVGQWTGDSLPASQKCGFGTNSYSRGFDISELTGDRCLAGRIELAANVVRPGRGSRTWVQAFGGLDRGRVSQLGNSFLPDSTGVWSSGTLGVRALGKDWVAEISASEVLASPSWSATAKGDRRLWFRAAMRF